MEAKQTIESLRRWVLPKLETAHEMTCDCDKCLLKAQISLLLFIAAQVQPEKSARSRLTALAFEMGAEAVITDDYGIRLCFTPELPPIPPSAASG